MKTPRMPRKSEATHPDVYVGMPAEDLKFIFLMLAIQSDMTSPPRGALISLLAWLKGFRMYGSHVSRLLCEGWEGYYRRTDEALLNEILILCEVGQDSLDSSLSVNAAQTSLSMVVNHRIPWYPESPPYQPPQGDVVRLVSSVCVKLCQNRLRDEDWVRKQCDTLGSHCPRFERSFWMAFAKCRDIEVYISDEGVLTAHIISGPSRNTRTWKKSASITWRDGKVTAQMLRP